MTTQRLNDRYEIVQQLGKRTGRETLLARDLSTEKLVVIKLLKLFEREALILQKLSHPAIPQYLDYFEFDLPQYKGFAIVQTYLEAKSLEQHRQTGRTFTEDEVKQIAEQLLEILSYLHDRHSRGKVRVNVKSSLIDFIALTDDPNGFQTGDQVLVVEMKGNQIWVVSADFTV
jgi:serine/threonine protein kinase